MKVTLDHGSLLIVGETLFEEDWLSELAPIGKTVELHAFLKTEMTATEIIGVKIEKTGRVVGAIEARA